MAWATADLALLLPLKEMFHLLIPNALINNLAGVRLLSWEY